MRKVARILILTLIVSILGSLGMMNVSASIDESLDDVNNEPTVLVDVDFTTLDSLDGLEAYGIKLEGYYEFAPDPKNPSQNVLKLLKNGVDPEDTNAVADPGTLIAEWNNGHATGYYRIQIETYIDATVSGKYMQAPFIFAKVDDTDYIDADHMEGGLEITKVSYDESHPDAGQEKLRVYANVLAGIHETDGKNYLAANDMKGGTPIANWFATDLTINTVSGECTAELGCRPATKQTRTFDGSMSRAFAPNRAMVVASSAYTTHTCDTYIKRILVTGPAENVPFRIDSVKLDKEDGTTVDAIADAKTIDNVVVKRNVNTDPRDFDVIIVEYKDNVFNGMKLLHHDSITEPSPGDDDTTVDIDISVDDAQKALNDGTTSIKVMLWDSFKSMAPITRFIVK